MLLTCPSRDNDTRNNGCASDCGEMIKRPLLSTAIQIHDPSLRSAECNSSTLNPGATVNDSADVARWFVLRSAAGRLRALGSAPDAPLANTNNPTATQPTDNTDKTRSCIFS